MTVNGPIDCHGDRTLPHYIIYIIDIVIPIAAQTHWHAISDVRQVADTKLKQRGFHILLLILGWMWKQHFSFFSKTQITTETQNCLFLFVMQIYPISYFINHVVLCQSLWPTQTLMLSLECQMWLWRVTLAGKCDQEMVFVGSGGWERDSMKIKKKKNIHRQGKMNTAYILSCFSTNTTREFANSVSVFGLWIVLVERVWHKWEFGKLWRLELFKAKIIAESVICQIVPEQ